MAYSRWSKHCRWYTFWSTSNSAETEFKIPTEKLKRAQVLEICDFHPYYISYGTLQDRRVFDILDDIQAHYASLETNPSQIAEPPTFEEMWELWEYLTMFRRDVDEYFKLKNFIANEWYYPAKCIIKSKIRKHLNKKNVKN